MSKMILTDFKEKKSYYLQDLMVEVKKNDGDKSEGYKALYNQYCYTQNETFEKHECNLKHYEAGVGSNKMSHYVERLYKRQAVVELTMVCAAHCRYCLRSNYEKVQITKKEILEVIHYLATNENIREILITGGDPLVVPKLLMYFIDEVINKAKNIKIIRIGTRLPVQDPSRIDKSLFSFFKRCNKYIRLECGIQINHPIELQQEACKKIEQLNKSGVRVYSQNVLLKGVNDKLHILIELYDKLRYLGVEAHYLFHPVPIKRTSHFRLSIEEALQLIRQLTASGNISGRIKPMLALMTDVGKVILYEGTLQSKDENGYYEVKTAYKLQERLKWNESYKLPESARIGKDGYIYVNYLDGGQ